MTNKCKKCNGTGKINSNGTIMICMDCYGTGMDKTGRRLAIQHANWLFDLLRKVYVEAFEHGYKHGMDAREEE